MPPCGDVTVSAVLTHRYLIMNLDGCRKLVESSIPLRSTTRFPVNWQPRFGDVKVAHFRRFRPLCSSYLRQRDAAARNFPQNSPSVSTGEYFDHSLECDPKAGRRLSA